MSHMYEHCMVMHMYIYIYNIYNIYNLYVQYVQYVYDTYHDAAILEEL